MKRTARWVRVGLAFALALPVLCGCKAGTGGPTFSLLTIYVAEIKLPEWDKEKEKANEPAVDTQPARAMDSEGLGDTNRPGRVWTPDDSFRR